MSKYTAVSGASSGDQISATGQGRHLTFLESKMVHPAHADGLVDVGDPVLVGEGIVGRAFASAAAATDYVAIDTEGLWQFNVVLTSGGSVGDTIYIDGSTAVLSDSSSGYVFGKLLDDVSADASAQLAPIKIHMCPAEVSEES